VTDNPRTADPSVGPAASESEEAVAAEEAAAQADGDRTEVAGDGAKVHGDPLEEAQPAGPAASDDGGLGAELAALRSGLDERTADLQRITAEYANYRKRVERDRALVVEQATGNVLAVLLPVLDDLDRAREHGDLTGPMAAVADQLVAGVGKFGLAAFGSKGDPFDPTRHEAVAHSTSADVTEPTCVEIMRRGYLLGERLLRPALVAVADPE